MTDTISDMLIRIKNAYLAGKQQIEVPHSREKQAIAEVLVGAGYLTQTQIIKNERGQQVLLLTLKYVGTTPAVTDVKRISKPGCRVYVTAAKIPAVLHGYGLAILSTSLGILPGQAARAKGVGGELLAEIW